LGATIRDYLIIEAESFEYFREKEFGDSFGGDRLVARAENYPLCKPMVDHDHDRIEASGFGEIGNQINGELSEGARSRGRNRSQGGSGGVSVALHLLAESTAIDILPDKSAHTRPPKIPFNKPLSLMTTRVAGGRVVMVQKKNTTAKMRRNIGTVFVIKGAVFNFPVRKCGAHRGGAVTMQSLRGSDDNRVGGRVIMFQGIREGFID
jgi:hypothetical protein